MGNIVQGKQRKKENLSLFELDYQRGLAPCADTFWLTYLGRVRVILQG